MTNEQTEQVLALDPSAAGRVVTLRAAAWRAGIVGRSAVAVRRVGEPPRRRCDGFRRRAARRGVRHPRPDRRSVARVPRDGRRRACAREGAGRALERAVTRRTIGRSLGLDRPWPPVLRAVAGGAAGWAAIRWGVTEPVPAWARGGAAGVSAVGGLAAPAVARSVGAIVVYGWASASALGLYLGVPETDHVVGVAAVLAVLLVASLAAPGRASWVLVVGLDVVLAWAAVRGAPAGGPPLVAGLAMPGLLVVAPLTSHLPGPAARHRARRRPAGRVGRSAGRLRRRHRPHCGTDRHDRGGRDHRCRRAGRARRGCPPRRRIPIMVKRAIDVVLAATLLVVTAPLLAAIALAVRILDGPPVLFHQARSGRGGRPFELVKFRTMRPARPHEAGPQHDMARLTRIGRFLRETSLDELPTLLHVVRGDMALVGPRPLPVAYLPRYDDTQARRLEVRPGITGWAQVNGRNTTGWDERMAMDVWYVDHASLALDMRILARTVGMVLRGDGVEHAPGVTMTEFVGPGTDGRGAAATPVACRPRDDGRHEPGAAARGPARCGRRGRRRGHRDQRARAVRRLDREAWCAPRPAARIDTRLEPLVRRPGGAGAVAGPATRAADGAAHAQPEARAVRTHHRSSRRGADRRQHRPRPVRHARRSAGPSGARVLAGGVRVTLVRRRARPERRRPRAHATPTPRRRTQAPAPRQRRRPAAVQPRPRCRQACRATRIVGHRRPDGDRRNGRSPRRREGLHRAVRGGRRSGPGRPPRRRRRARCRNGPTPSTRWCSSGPRPAVSCCSVIATTSTSCSAASTCSCWRRTAKANPVRRWRPPQPDSRSWRRTSAAAVRSSTTGRPDCSCPWPTHGALRAAIGELAASPDRRRAMGAAGRAKAEREFDEREVVRRVMDAYTWAAARRGITLG